MSHCVYMPVVVQIIKLVKNLCILCLYIHFTRYCQTCFQSDQFPFQLAICKWFIDIMNLNIYLDLSIYPSIYLFTYKSYLVLLVVWVCRKLCLSMGLSRWLSGKEHACQAEALGSIPWSRRSPREGNGHLLQYFCLGNPMDRRAWQATVHKVAESSAYLATKLQQV